MTAQPARSICLRRVPWRTALMLLFAVGVWLGGSTRTLAAEVIQSFDSNVRLARDGELTVTETVRVQAEGRDIRHGIYRDFPLTFKDANGAIREVDFTMRDLLGGKGAGLAEMANLGLPVPPGFTITTDVCTYYYSHNKQYPKDLRDQVEKALARVGRITGRKFDDETNPLLVSVRSGARASMPGMMDTVLNLGLNDETVETIAKRSGDRRFAYDSYRRFITMYSDVVLGVGHEHFEELLDRHKEQQGYTLDTDLSADDWADLVVRYKKRVKDELGQDFPQNPHEQLWGAIGAVFGSCGPAKNTAGNNVGEQLRYS